jgi:3-hydroxyanthranilate 3,4-dioxygenase
MSLHPTFKPFNFMAWIEANRHLLKPPVSNRQLFDQTSGMIVMVVGGPNQRVDFHDDPVEEFFYQIKGDLLLKVADRGKVYDVPVREGEVFLMPPHMRHSPQRPFAGSFGLVVESARAESHRDGFEWFCFGCGERLHRVEVKLEDVVADLPPLYDAFYADTDRRTCKSCGAVHPGKEPPAGWSHTLTG